MQILPATAQGVHAAAQHLLGGGVLGMPTETVYGLAAVAHNPHAVAQIFAAKERPHFDPLIMHVAPEHALLPLLAPHARPLLARLGPLLHEAWPGPLTVVLPRAPTVLDLVTSGLPTVAVRMPAHPVAQALLRAVGEPLVAPSANRFGRISPTTAEAVVSELSGRVPFVLQGGPCQVGVESTILRLPPEGPAELLRPGGFPVERIEHHLGAVVRRADPGSAPTAPGQLASHYAPHTPLRLLPGPVEDAALPPLGRVALLRLSGPTAGAVAHLQRQGSTVVEAISLSPTGHLGEIAQGLFAALRHLDNLDVQLILAEPCAAPTGLGHAITDRLQRASCPDRMKKP